MNRGSLTTLVLLVFVALPARDAAAQFRYGGGGSTVQGDILRGEGVFFYGLGQFNLSSAMANSINVDTAIRWNQYVYLSIEEDNRKKALHRMARAENNKENFEAIQTRIRENPNLADLRNGDALNAVLEQLLDPKVSPSAFRNSQVALAGDTVNTIPFFYGPQGVTFSMRRLLDKSGWPISLRGVDFALERKAYERAMDRALDQNLEGRLSVDTVNAVIAAVDDLQTKVDRVIPQYNKDLYVQARNYIKSLMTSAQMLKSPVVERVLAAVEVYPGTTIDDLRLFMQANNLRFGVAETPEERKLYHEVLYPNLILQRNGVVEPDIK